MFEAVVAICLSVANGPCRDQLLPGYEAASEAGCVEKLAARPGPNGARCVPVGAAISVQEVAPGIFVHVGEIAEPDTQNRGDVSNMAFVIGEDAVMVIDTGTARWMGEGLWRAIRANTDKPVSHVVLTHMHPDHVLGVSVFADAGAQVVGHQGLARALSDRAQNYLESLETLVGPQAFIGTELRPVDLDVAIGTPLPVDLGGRSVEVRAWPAAHTRVDMTVSDAQTGILFAGDLVFHRHAPALDGKLRGWQAVLAEMSKLNVTHVVPGHGGPLLRWPEGGVAQSQYLDSLATDTEAAIAKGQRLGDAVGEIAQGEAANWELFEAYNPRNATVAFTELEWE